MRYQVGAPKVLSFEEAVAILDEGEFAKDVLRSTVPMLSYWRDTSAWWSFHRFSELLHASLAASDSVGLRPAPTRRHSDMVARNVP
jgi:hypothetical protein